MTLTGREMAAEVFTFAKNVALHWARTHGVYTQHRQDDIVGYGMLGLMQASLVWDSSDDLQGGVDGFRGFAHPYIKWAIVDGIRLEAGRHGQKNIMDLAGDEESVWQEYAYHERGYEDVDNLGLVEGIRKVLSPRDFDLAVVPAFLDRKKDMTERLGVHQAMMNITANKPDVQYKVRRILNEVA